MRFVPYILAAACLCSPARADEPKKEDKKVEQAQAEKPKEKPPEKAAEKTAEKPTEKSTDKPTDKPAEKAKENSISKITKKEIEEITFEDVEEDTGFITPIVKDLDSMDEDSKKRLDAWTNKLIDWSGYKEENVPQRVRNLMHICALADMVHSEFEGETAYVVFDRLRSEVEKEELIKACAWIVLKPDEGRAITRAPELGWDDENEEAPLRERAALYAKKLLGRLEGKLPKKE